MLRVYLPILSFGGGAGWRGLLEDDWRCVMGKSSYNLVTMGERKFLICLDPEIKQF
jgi:hypothetical protein